MWRYVVTHWQGKQSLPRSALVNGALLYLLLVVVPIPVGQFSNNNPIVTTLGIGVFLLWMLWALVGIFRCGARVAVDRAKPTLARIGGVIAVAGASVVIVASINDARHLGLFKWPL